MQNVWYADIRIIIFTISHTAIHCALRKTVTVKWYNYSLLLSSTTFKAVSYTLAVHLLKVKLI